MASSVAPSPGMSITGSFKKQYTLEKRRAESARIRAKYPDRIPVIAERAANTHLPHIDKKKYLVPGDLTAGQFVYVIRKRIKLTPEQAMFVFLAKNTLPPTAALMSHLYAQNKDEDGFLYVVYSGESTFGQEPPTTEEKLTGETAAA